MDAVNQLQEQLSDEAVRNAEVDEALGMIIATEVTEVPESVSVSDVIVYRQEAAVLGSQLSTLADQADKTVDVLGGTDNAPAIAVAQENLAVALDLVVKGKVKGRKSIAPTFESSVTPTDRLFQTAVSIRGLSDRYQSNLKATLESMYGDVRKSQVWLRKENSTIQAAIRKAIGAIKSSQTKIDEGSLTLDHKGLYFFLSRGGKPVHDLKAELATDLKILEDLVTAEKAYSAFYTTLVDQIRKIGSTGKVADLQSLFTELSKFNSLSPVAGLLGRKTLASGVIEKIEYEDDEYDEIEDVWRTIKEPAILQIYYGNTKGDGSKASIVKRATSFIKGAGIGGILGAITGGVLLTTAAPIVIGVGAALGAAVGGAASVKNANNDASGSKTSTKVSAADLISFLEDCARAVDIQDKTTDFETRVESAQNDVDKNLKLFVKLIDTGKTNSNKIVINTGSGSATIDSDDGNASTEQIIDAVREQLDVVYAMHMSVVETLNEHTNTIVNGGLLMAKKVLETVK